MTGGTYIYALLDRSGAIRYVGKTYKSVEERLYAHIKNRLRAKTPCGDWIGSLLVQGHKPEVVVLEIIPPPLDDRWREAERFWINYCRSIGCDLLNLAEGGYGPNRYPLEVLKRMSETSRRTRATPEQIALRSTPEYRKRMSEAGKKAMSSAAARARIASQSRLAMQNPEARKYLSEVQKRRFADPEERRILSERAKSLQASPEYRKSMSDAVSKAQTDEVRAKKSVSQKKRYDLPGERERAAANARKIFSDPSIKAKHRASLVAMWVRRKAQSVI